MYSTLYKISAAVFSLLAALVIIILGMKSRDSSPEIKEKRTETVRKMLYGKNENRYEKTVRFLSETGADYMFKKEINPVVYMLIRTGIALFFIVAAISKGYFFAAAVLGVTGFMCLPVILNYSNSSDNKKMLPDIKNMYDTLSLKTEAGVFFTDALPECYRVVQSGRLKAALLELNAGIIVRNDIENSIYHFNRKFRNRYIDTFCIIIRQALESGQTVQVLNDMSSQMADIEKAINEAQKEKQDMQETKIQLLVYGALMLIICFYVVSIMGRLGISFS